MHLLYRLTTVNMKLTLKFIYNFHIVFFTYKINDFFLPVSTINILCDKFLSRKQLIYMMKLFFYRSVGTKIFLYLL